MSRIMIAIVGLAVVIVAGLAVTHALMRPSAEVDLSRSKASAAGLYQTEVAPEADPPTTGAMNSWVLTIKRPDGQPVEEARISVTGGMPQHGHGLPTAPQATAYLGAGRYRIEGVRFNMSGNWVLEFAISAAPGDDRVTFNVAM